MGFATNFDKYLKKGLVGQTTGYNWETGWHEKGQSWKVDVGGCPEKSGPLVLIEVELKKDNPVENVVKIWRWATHEKNKSRIMFLHAFSAHYHIEDPTSGSRSTKPKRPPKTKQYERAVFIGQRMEEDRRTLHIDYKKLPIYTTTHAGKRIPFTPLMRRGSVVKEGGGAMQRAAEELAKDIAKLLHTKSHR